jgi:hypothetical protein
MGKTTRRLVTAAAILFILGFSLLSYSTYQLIQYKKRINQRQLLPSRIVPYTSENILWWSEPEFIPHWVGHAREIGYIVPPEVWVKNNRHLLYYFNFIF